MSWAKIVACATGFTNDSSPDTRYKLALLLAGWTGKKRIADLTVGYIDAASEHLCDTRRSHVHASVENLVGLGCTVLPINLTRCPWRAAEEARKSDVMYVEDGIGTHLAFLLHTSGFSELLPRLLENGKPFVGSGAGCVVLKENISYSRFVLNQHPWPHPEENSIAGLGLTERSIVPHANPAIRLGCRLFFPRSVSRPLFLPNGTYAVLERQKNGLYDIAPACR